MDVNKQISMVVKTGKVELGCKEATDAVKTAKARLIIIASNCPEPHKSNILYNAKLSEVPVYVYSGTSVDLGTACERRFLVAAITVKEPGDSEILKLAEK
ncbi:50S ribosomal protein L30e [Candidatus Bathyarchaeota archaeon]|jgi:large subunit ribosomal protein L30e|nr:50S ribosomal protein L30e [Candidatus Bathyarchaeota archaeon]